MHKKENLTYMYKLGYDRWQKFSSSETKTQMTWSGQADRCSNTEFNAICKLTSILRVTLVMLLGIASELLQVRMDILSTVS